MRWLRRLGLALAGLAALTLAAYALDVVATTVGARRFGTSWWGVLGALAGTLASMLFYRQRTRFRELSNLILGLLGALLGGALFTVLNIRLGLPSLTFSLDDLVAAIVGSLLLLLLIRLMRR